MICSKKDHLPGGFSIDLFLYLGKSEICKKPRSPEKEENLEKESEKKPLMEPVATLVGSNEAPSVVVSVLPDTQEWRVAGETARLSRIFPGDFWVDDDFHKAFDFVVGYVSWTFPGGYLLIPR